LGLVGLLPAGVRLTDLPALLPEVGIDAAANVRQVGGLTFDDRTTNGCARWLRCAEPPGGSAPARRRTAAAPWRLLPDGGRTGRPGWGRRGAEASARITEELDNLTAMVRARVEEEVSDACEAALSLGSFGALRESISRPCWNTVGTERR